MLQHLQQVSQHGFLVQQVVRRHGIHRLRQVRLQQGQQPLAPDLRPERHQWEGHRQAWHQEGAPRPAS